MDAFSGVMEHVVFANEDNGYTVAKVKIPGTREPVTIVGTLPVVQPGETIHCEGVWKHHAKFGQQFEIKTFEVTAPSDVAGIQKYLESGLIKGIGPKYAEKIVEYFGERTLEVIDRDPTELMDVPGIGKKKVEMISECWDAQKSIRGVMIFLQGNNVRSSIAQKIFRMYGDDSIAKIKEDPYMLAKNVFGIGFKSADDLAMKLGIPEDSPLRINGAIEHVLWEMSSNGHSCYPQDELIECVVNLIDADFEMIKLQIGELEGKGRIVTLDHKVWVKPLYLAELNIAKNVLRLRSEKASLRAIDTSKGLSWVEEKMGLEFAKQQKEAICLAVQEKLHIITGGPGTGKSTITKAIIKITEKLTNSIVLAAPTGRAAKRMSEITGMKAQTIHSLLEYDFTGRGFKRDKENPLDVELLIVDEASMIDTQLMSYLLSAIPSYARLILIGDIDQLPSVGPGNVLKDLIDSDEVPVSMLNEIFRQAKSSRIVTAAHSINKGYLPDLDYDEASDFIFLESPTPEDSLAKILELVKVRIPRKFNMSPFSEIQVLAPMKKGVIGTENLNIVLQEALNPSEHPLVKMGRSFHEGDKVMQIRNNYNKNIYNGDVGIIDRISLDDQELVVCFDGIDVFYDFTELDELVLAYAVSIHKYQGSECSCIVIPVHLCHFKLLYRNLLYTGLTRGRRLVVLLGTTKALALAVKNNDVLQRHTGLRQLLKHQMVTL
ncbi:MAG: ATP-dependent RecD-like DNA helicase [Chlamydiia bacterium]|nr:ATP-dependent RecD-like DNA helicase [Chlamydiia bacterium]MCH9615938.1 ATP-dependent RecD-like DNA helicase [Chlamydiia bacterium]MCH9628659.1 ATP-dependent RecD-like DNA helicase [Chlamydiia bacterium]